MAGSGGESRLRFGRAQRLSLNLDYQRVLGGGVRTHRGPLAVYAQASGTGRARLGMSVSRRVGNAVKRNAIKRRLREAFRLSQRDLPALDLVVRVRPHRTMAMGEYRELLVSAAASLERKLARGADGGEGASGDHGP